MSKIIEVKNGNVTFVSQVISSLQIEGQKSYARRRFLRTIKPFMSDLEAEQKELQLKYCEKTGDEPKVVEGQYVFKPKNRKEFGIKWEELNTIMVKIDVTTANEADIISVSQIITDEITRYEAEKKDKYTASEYDYVEVLKECVASLVAKEV
jgi:hypothetical protein